MPVKNFDPPEDLPAGCKLIWNLLALPTIICLVILQNSWVSIKDQMLRWFGRKTVCEIIATEEYSCSDDFGWRGKYVYSAENGRRYEIAFNGCYHWPWEYMTAIKTIYAVGATHEMLYLPWYPRLHQVDFPNHMTWVKPDDGGNS